MKEIVLSLLVACSTMLFVNMDAVAEMPFADSFSLTAGSGAWTNARDYDAIELTHLEIFGVDPAAWTQAFKRVRSGRTNNVAAIVASSGAGIYRETNTTYLFKGDVLLSAGTTNAGTVEITGKVWP